MTLDKKELEELLQTTSTSKPWTKRILRGYVDHKIDGKLKARWNVDALRREVYYFVGDYKYIWKEELYTKALRWFTLVDRCNEKQLLKVQETIDGVLK